MCAGDACIGRLQLPVGQLESTVKYRFVFLVGNGGIRSFDDSRICIRTIVNNINVSCNCAHI